MKTCTKCSETKPLDEFSFDKRYSRHKSHCKSCVARHAREVYAKNTATEKPMSAYRLKIALNIRDAAKGFAECSTCGCRKNTYEFSKSSKSLTGVSQDCKSCDGIRYLKKIGYRDLISNKSADTPEAREIHRKATRKAYRDSDHGKSVRNRCKHARRARLAGLPSNDWSSKDVYKEANGRCLYCGIKMPFSEMHTDHFIPVAKGGTNLRDNIVCSCASCNLLKSAKLPQDFISPNLIGGSK